MKRKKMKFPNSANEVIMKAQKELMLLMPYKHFILALLFWNQAWSVIERNMQSHTNVWNFWMFQIWLNLTNRTSLASILLVLTWFLIVDPDKMNVWVQQSGIKLQWWKMWNCHPIQDPKNLVYILWIQSVYLVKFSLWCEGISSSFPPNYL